MKIAFLSELNPNDIHAWSGTLYHIFRTLAEAYDIEWLGGDLVQQAKLCHLHTPEGFLQRFCTEAYARRYGEILSEQINKGDYDLAIVRDSWFAAHLDIAIPLVFIGDATFRQFNQGYLHLADTTYVALREQLEQAMFDNADKLIFCSEWARRGAIEYYGVPSGKTEVIEFGANLPEIGREAIVPLVKKGRECHLVFIGKSWHGKGGDKVLGVAQILQQRGILCKVTLIGSEPERQEVLPNDITVIPYLDKAKPDDLKRMDKVLQEADFMVLPTRFDCFGIVFCEASAYGVPSIASNVGGVSQVIKNGRNGYLLEPEASTIAYANTIEQIYNDQTLYLSLRKNTRKEYEARLNWNIWNRRITKIFSGLVEKNKSSPKIRHCDDFFLPTYIINLSERNDRRTHMQKQFEKRSEFQITWVDACKHPIGAVGLWQSIVQAVHMAVDRDDDVILICEDDHRFTSHYAKDRLLREIAEANEQGVHLLSGGIGGFGIGIPVAKTRFWVDWYWSNQFIILFKHAFQHILDYSFQDTDTADEVLSVILPTKQVIWPFISVQENFGYSDVTLVNNRKPDLIEAYFVKSEQRLKHIRQIYDHYHPQIWL